MPGLQANEKIWRSEWDWSELGHEWSAWWGGTDSLWFGAILPRIHPYLRNQTILEIAPGFGRWTQYLKDECEHLVIVDLAERCIDHCRQRFSSDRNITYHVNDGRSLAMVEDGSIDFAFSFDSLVHAELDVIDAYLVQLRAKLTPDGAAFLHHSNLGAYRRLNDLTHRLPQRVRRRMMRRGLVVDIAAWRAPSVTAERVSAAARRIGLVPIAQETIRWERGWQQIDALTLLTLPGSRFEREPVSLQNPGFQRQAEVMRSLWSSTPGRAPS